jgi:adenylate cyclase
MPIDLHVNRAFAKHERRTERLVAALRLLALGSLALLNWSVRMAEQSQTTIVPLGGLAASTLAAFFINRTRLFRPWMLWVVATVDIALLFHCLEMVSVANRKPLGLTLDTPAALLIFVFLATAAVRYRPFLIVYTGGLFVAGWLLIWLVSYLNDDGSRIGASLPNDLARLVIIGVATYALFVTVKRSQRTLTSSISESHRRTNLSRYFSPQLVEEIAATQDTTQSFRLQKAAILFADLRGFTGLAERMQPDQLAGFLNDYRRRITEPIARHGGVIDKFIGDGVMAIFGVPEPGSDDARHAVMAGLELVSAIGDWRAERLAKGLPAVEIGIGIHYGDVMAGILGEEERLEYTCIGDAVNAAARIERVAADIGAALVVSADVLSSAPGLEEVVKLDSLSMHALRGRSQSIRLYQVSEAAGAATPSANR